MANILIIEDDSFINGYYCKVFEQNGHNCTIVTTSSDAISSIRGNHYDLIILDLYLETDENGLDFIQLAQKIYIKLPPIILITSVNSPKIHSKFYEYGVVKCLLKPVTKSDLLDLINIYLKENI